MKIREVTDHRKAYLDLLLLADEQEDMIDCFMNPAAFAGTIWSRTFSLTTTTTPSTSAGCGWWIWCTCKESYEKRSACEHSAFC